MSIFEQPFGWVKNIFPSDSVEKDSIAKVISPEVRDLRGDEYLATVKLWKEQIEKGVAGEYGSRYEFIDKELGIKNERSGKSLFVTIDKNSSLLNSEPFMEIFDESFQKKMGVLMLCLVKF